MHLGRGLCASREHGGETVREVAYGWRPVLDPFCGGGSIPLEAQLLGHEGVDTTRIYTTPSEQDLQREVEKVAIT